MERNYDHYRSYNNNAKSTPQSFQALLVEEGEWEKLAGNITYAPAYVHQQLKERTSELSGIVSSRQTYIRDSAPVEPTDLNQYWAGLPEYGRNKS